jgi:predicted  nucleic acid-binding Zn-ribbon protein
MTSQIDATKPTEGQAYTNDVRTNFAIARDEISNLQGASAIDEANIATLQQQVLTLQTNAATDEANIATLQSQVADLETRVSALEAAARVTGGSQ